MGTPLGPKYIPYTYMGRKDKGSGRIDAQGARSTV